MGRNDKKKRQRDKECDYDLEDRYLAQRRRITKVSPQLTLTTDSREDENTGSEKLNKNCIDDEVEPSRSRVDEKKRRKQQRRMAREEAAKRELKGSTQYRTSGSLTSQKQKKPSPKPANPPLTHLTRGVTYFDKIVGSGKEAKSGQRVCVAYVGKALDASGMVFDRSQKFMFRLGKGEVIRGWDIGVVGMRVGGTRCLFVPKGAGYGNQDIGAGVGATLFFEIRLLS